MAEYQFIEPFKAYHYLGDNEWSEYPTELMNWARWESTILAPSGYSSHWELARMDSDYTQTIHSGDWVVWNPQFGISVVDNDDFNNNFKENQND